MSNEVGPVPEGYVLWDGKEGDLVPEGALVDLHGKWVHSRYAGRPCQSAFVGFYAVPAPAGCSNNLITGQLGDHPQGADIEREIYTDCKGQQWVEDPKGSHVDWRGPGDRWVDGVFWPVEVNPHDVHGAVLDNGLTTVRLSCVPPEVEPGPDIMTRPVVDEAAAVASGYCDHSRIDYREALARVVRVVTGAEPDQKVLDHLMAKGARCFWVEVPR